MLSYFQLAFDYFSLQSFVLVDISLESTWCVVVTFTFVTFFVCFSLAHQIHVLLLLKVTQN